MSGSVKNNDDLIITRMFNAPRGRVWKAWSDQERFQRWWGPKLFTAPHAGIDFRVGGKYLACMRSPEGQDFWSTGVYLEIVPEERIVSTDSFADENGNVVPASHYGMSGDWPEELQVTVTFEDSGGGTKMMLRHVGIPPGQMKELTAEGWNGSFDKLAESLELEQGQTGIIAEPGRQEIVITRFFDAPRMSVFRAYADPWLISEWWGPKRYSTIVENMDVRPGGIWRFINRDAEGNEYAFHGVYHAVRPPEKLVYTFEFEGMPGHAALETVSFEEIDGKTRMTSRSVYQSVEDRDEMLREGMEEGVAETMDRLAELLAKSVILKKAA